MCKFFLDGVECEFPAVKYDDLLKWAGSSTMAGRLPYTTVYVAWKARRFEDNAFLHTLISRLEICGDIVKGKVFEGNLEGRSIFVCQSMDEWASMDLEKWLSRLCVGDWILCKPYAVARRLKDAGLSD